MATYSRIAKWIIELAADEERNPHGLTACQIADRHYNRKWPLDEILSTPLMNHTQAARRAAKASPWSKWEPGKFSRSDKSRRKDIPSWDDSLSS
jgi:hypothetical protein